MFICLAVGLCLSSASPTAADDAPSLWQRLIGLFRSIPIAEEPCHFGGVGGEEDELPEATPLVPVIKKEWEQFLGGEEAAKPYIRARLAAQPTRLLGDKPATDLSDRDFVSRVARDTWNGLEALVDRSNGLPINNVRVTMSAEGVDLQVGDYTSATDIGLHLIATTAAYEIGFITATQAENKIAQILFTLGELETRAGFHFNFYDTTSLERTSNFISFVDSSWLTAGLIVARSAFPMLYDACARIIAAGDYRFFYDDNLRHMSHGYDVNRSRRSRYHYGVLYAESRLGSLIAIGKGDVPEEHWFAMVRTFPASCDWQKQKPNGRRVKQVGGHSFSGGWYEWKDLKYVPSWGGSMFEALMPQLLIDEVRWAPRSLGRNDALHTEVQRRYALETLGYPVWGMSPSSTLAPGYDEFGVEVLGSAGYRAGLVTPHATALALQTAPAEAVANLRQLAQRYDIYGEYGFYDAVDPRTGEVAHAYLALDQSMSFIAMVNYLKDGCIQKHFAADPIVQRALPLLAGEEFFE